MPHCSERLRPFLVHLTGLLVCALATATTLGLLGTARADASACSVSTMSGTNQPACWQPFSGTSPFNTPLPSAPALAPNSATVQQHMVQYGWALDGSTSGFTLKGGGSRPVYFGSPSDPVMTIHCTDEQGPGTCQGTNGIDVNGAQINVPAGARPDSNTDAHMTVIETATGTEFDFWHTSVSGSTLTAGAGAEVNVNSTDGTGSAGDAAFFGLTAGLLRPAELASGQIDHALVITVPCTDATGRTVGYTYPARAGWGEYCGQYWSEDAASAPMLGQRYQLDMTDAQIAASGAPGWEQTIMTALAHYGAYIEDTNGSWHYEGMDILTQDPASWTDLGQANQWASVVSALGGSNSTLHSGVPIPAADLQLVSTCVTQGTCPGASGPPLGGIPTSTPPVTPAAPIPAPPPAGTAPATPVGAAPALPAAVPSSPVRSTSTSRPSSPKGFRQLRRRRERAALRRAARRRAASRRRGGVRRARQRRLRFEAPRGARRHHTRRTHRHR